ncbi:hypothetical protein BN970_00393 [Mycolicibacterium conceptionense]|uniref:Uncharacterized protein n=1 Tax=Mycolicibacterium conceptionense TaxID=451644 RepID=A0A0U1CWD8_9MYCO|nr:hypothetical protein AWB98_11265 [Mycolicibacterium conceptionense]CQD03166.1 hypothetical protein BN970_00393 [Mycolicibacterium conceptionense]
MQLLFQPRRRRITTARPGSDHHEIRGIQIGYHRAGHMTQPPGHLVTLHRVPDGFGHDQTDPRAGSVRPLV